MSQSINKPHLFYNRKPSVMNAGKFGMIRIFKSQNIALFYSKLSRISCSLVIQFYSVLTAGVLCFAYISVSK